MSAADLITRVVFATVLIIVAGVMAVFTFAGVLEPFVVGVAPPPASLDWGTPIEDNLGLVAAAQISMLIAIIIWFISAPIRSDVRQEVR